MIFNLDSNEIKLQLENNCIRLTTNSDSNQLLANVTIEETQEIIAKNYNIVKNHYQYKVGESFLHYDLEKVSLKIVLRYFYMYQLWRKMYVIHKKRDLTFLKKDFEHPYTADEITLHFKSHYPNTYPEKCEVMLGLSASKFKEYEKNRQRFYDMW